MEDGNPNRTGNLINFAKRRLIGALIREAQQYQNQVFNFKRYDELMILLEDSMAHPYLNKIDGKPEMTMKEYEDSLFELSLKWEPRGADRAQIQ
jgi:hypothetical protein